MRGSGRAFAFIMWKVSAGIGRVKKARRQKRRTTERNNTRMEMVYTLNQCPGVESRRERIHYTDVCLWARLHYFKWVPHAPPRWWPVVCGARARCTQAAGNFFPGAANFRYWFSKNLVFCSARLPIDVWERSSSSSNDLPAPVTHVNTPDKFDWIKHTNFIHVPVSDFHTFSPFSISCSAAGKKWRWCVSKEIRLFLLFPPIFSVKVIAQRIRLKKNNVQYF